MVREPLIVAVVNATTLLNRSVARISSVVAAAASLKHSWPRPHVVSTSFAMQYTVSSSHGDQEQALTRTALMKTERARFLQMTPEEKRKYYKCEQNYVMLDSILPWTQYYQSRCKMKGKDLDFKKSEMGKCLSDKVSIWVGDITKLEVDAVVNAANSTLQGGGGVDGAIHRAAGSNLKVECSLLGGCNTGDAKITCGYHLPAKHVIHTVGPIGSNEMKLSSCYRRCLQVKNENNLRTIVFPCISTGLYGYPNRQAAHVALNTVCEWLQHQTNFENTDRIIFCLFQTTDVDIYEELLPVIFSAETTKSDQKDSETETLQNPPERD